MKTFLSGIFQLIIVIIAHMIEEDSEKKAKLHSAKEQLKQGLKERDTSKITEAFAKIKRVQK